MAMIGIYERVSHKSQKLDGQHAELDRWARAQGEEVKWYSDKATGKKMERPAFDAMMADSRRGVITKIVVWRLDRLGRTCRGLVVLFDELAELKIALVSLKDGLDLGTTTGRLVARIMASVAAYEVEVLTEKQRAGIEAARDPQTGKCGWGGRNKGTRISLTVEREKQAQKMKADGNSVASISRTLGIARKTVYVALARA